ncbi:MAG: prolyl aminopeptidase [Thiobacillaceae bacterium]
MSPQTGLFGPVEPHVQGFLEPDALHRIYWEESGNPKGMPVIFLHGGPGSGTSPQQRRFFDPEYYRIILFDQRGSGRSTPYGELKDNTTPHLIADIELLRETLGVDRWLVFGGSWGSTLALAYGEAYPERCLGFVLRGIFLCRKSEVDWFLNGMSTFFPEAWRQLVEPIPEEQRSNLLHTYYQQLIDPDPAVHLTAARAWSGYEARCSTLLPNETLVNSFESDVVALSLARIEAHYFMHDIFLPENCLLTNLHRIRHLPAVIVQGRYDAVCPIVTADELSRAWPEAFYEVVDDAGHSAFEPGITRALIQATEAFKDLLGDAVTGPKEKTIRRKSASSKEITGQ